MEGNMLEDREFNNRFCVGSKEPSSAKSGLKRGTPEKHGVSTKFKGSDQEEPED
jgi:hypothetical protein